MQRPTTPTTAQIHRGDGTIIRELRLLDLPEDAMGKPLSPKSETARYHNRSVDL
jgi:hypothetical protein